MKHKESNISHQRTEEDLREGEQKYKDLADSLPQTVAEIDIAGNITFTNLAGFEMFGYTKEDFDKGLNMFQMIAPEEHQRAMENLQKFMKGQSRDGEQYIGVRKDGSRFPFTVYLTPIFRKNKTVGFRIILIDITDHKRSEEVLRTSQMQLSEAMDLAHIVYWETDPTDNVFLFNDAFYTLYGTTAEQEGGYRMTRQEFSKRFVHPDDLPLVSQFVEQNTLRPDAEFIADIEHRIVRRDGEIRYILARTRIVKDDSGRIIKRYGANQDITDRKRAEKALKKSEELFRTMVETSSDVIMLLDQDLKRTFVSQNVEAILGYSVEEYLLQSTLDLIHPDFIEISKTERRWSMDHPGEPVTFISRIRHKNGSWRWIKVTGRNLLHNPNVRASVINYHDITENRRSEEALRASQVRLSEAMDLAKIVYWEVDLADNMFIFNDSFYAFYGTTAEQEGGYRMSGKEYVKRFIHPDDQLHISHRMGRNTAIPGLELLPDLEHRIVRRDGEVRHILARTKIVRDNSGRLIKRYGANQDITDRKRAEEAITKEKEKLKILSDNAPFGMVLIDTELHFTYMNRKFTELFGYDLSDVPDIETWRKKAYPDDEYRQTILASVREDFADAGPGDRRPRVFAVTCKDGTQKSIQFIVSFLASGDRLLTCEDITELRRLENQLRQAQKTEAIGTLVGGIAHDFNNILTALMGYAVLLQRKMDEGSASHAYAENILSASKKATDLIQNLLAFSRQQTISPMPVSIHDIIRKTQNLLERLLTEDIVIETQLAGEDIIIMADATQIDQILFNLATNARDAMPQGGTLTIETRLVELDNEFQRVYGYGKPGRYALLSVSDTGVGIDEATREKIFDPFFTTKEVGKGTGLGLSTVHGIVKQHNGFINVYSEPDMGTTFHIYLPVLDKADKEDEPVPVPIMGGDETILVAEDSKSVRDLIREILITYGYTIIEAIDGADAVDKFNKADKIDLLIFDSVMPKKNGREAYNEIRKIKQDIKIIFTSGHTRDVVLDKGIEDKEFNFLQKPILSDTLLRKVREVLDNGVGTRSQ